jgi:hypothetical protein
LTAQQISLPFSSQQVGLVYFLSGYKIGLFGIVNESLKKFYLYLIPESCKTGKGANLVISLLHHFFAHFAVGEEHVVCHADNCTGQNKNNYLLQYAAWRVKQKLHKSFQMEFMPVGHTRFAVDAYFGGFKVHFRRSDCYTVRDVIRTALEAFPHSNACTVIVVGTVKGKMHIAVNDYAEWFTSGGAKKLPQVSVYQHFRTSCDDPGVMYCSKILDGPEDKYVLLPDTFKEPEHCPIIRPTKLTAACRKYLHDKFVPLIPSKYHKHYLWRGVRTAQKLSGGPRSSTRPRKQRSSQPQPKQPRVSGPPPKEKQPRLSGPQPKQTQPRTPTRHSRILSLSEM